MRAFVQIAAIGVVASSLFGSISIGAQRGGGERSGPAQPPLFLPDDEYLRWPLPASEQAYAGLSGRRIKSYIEEITAISRQSRADGHQYWGRITGTPYDKMTTDWIAAQFRRVQVLRSGAGTHEAGLLLRARQRGIGDVERRLRVIQLALGRDALPVQILDALQLGCSPIARRASLIDRLIGLSNFLRARAGPQLAEVRLRGAKAYARLPNRVLQVEAGGIQRQPCLPDGVALIRRCSAGGEIRLERLCSGSRERGCGAARLSLLRPAIDERQYLFASHPVALSDVHLDQPPGDDRGDPCCCALGRRQCPGGTHGCFHRPDHRRCHLHRHRLGFRFLRLGGRGAALAAPRESGDESQDNKASVEHFNA